MKSLEELVSEIERLKSDIQELITDSEYTKIDKRNKHFSTGNSLFYKDEFNKAIDSLSKIQSDLVYLNTPVIFEGMAAQLHDSDYKSKGYAICGEVHTGVFDKEEKDPYNLSDEVVMCIPITDGMIIEPLYYAYGFEDTKYVKTHVEEKDGDLYSKEYSRLYLGTQKMNVRLRGDTKDLPTMVMEMPKEEQEALILSADEDDVHMLSDIENTLQKDMYIGYVSDIIKNHDLEAYWNLWFHERWTVINLLLFVKSLK